MLFRSASIARWMKDPGSLQLGSMTAARNRFGVVTVCGEINGRTGSGRYAGMSPFVGVLLGPPVRPVPVLIRVTAPVLMEVHPDPTS